jgi:hypothetical protein
VMPGMIHSAQLFRTSSLQKEVIRRIDSRHISRALSEYPGLSAIFEYSRVYLSLGDHLCENNSIWNGVFCERVHLQRGSCPATLTDQIARNLHMRRLAMLVFLLLAGTSLVYYFNLPKYPVTDLSSHTRNNTFEYFCFSGLSASRSVTYDAQFITALTIRLLVGVAAIVKLLGLVMSRKSSRNEINLFLRIGIWGVSTLFSFLIMVLYYANQSRAI